MNIVFMGTPDFAVPSLKKLVENQYYIKEGSIPMCDAGEPTLNVASQWLNLPKNQTIKFSLEANLK